jgi:hypothetical protein
MREGDGMANFSATDVAFAGFGVLGKRPFAWVARAGVYILYLLLLGLVLVGVMGARMASLQGLAGQAGGAARPPTPAEMQALVAIIGPIYAVAIPITLLFAAIMLANVYRVVLRPEEGAPFCIGVGKAELMQMLLALVMFVVFIVGGIAFAIVGGTLGFAISQSPPSTRPLLGFLEAIALICAFIWIGVRLSLAGPATFAEGRLGILQSWRLTKGAFWSLFGAYLLAVIVAIVIEFLVFGVGFLLMAGLGVALGGAGDLRHVDPKMIAGPAMIVGLVFLVAIPLLASFMQGMIFGPGAAAYRALAGDDQAKAF